MDNVIKSCACYQYVDCVLVSRRRICRNYYKSEVKVTYYYDDDMKYLIALEIENCDNRRYMRRYQEFIKLVYRKGGSIVYFNTTIRANIELGDLLLPRTRRGITEWCLKSTLLSLVYVKGRYLLVRHETKQRTLDCVIVKEFDLCPRPIDMKEYSLECPHEVCSSDNTQLLSCSIGDCFCLGKGRMVKCNDCNKVGHLCIYGCGIVVKSMKQHARVHSTTGDTFRDIYFGEKEVKHAWRKRYINYKKLSLV